MHLLVLSAFRRPQHCSKTRPHPRSQCTFWCSVLSDPLFFRWTRRLSGLNAPFGAQCFPTKEEFNRVVTYVTSLNAPFGAQCFPTLRKISSLFLRLRVSMHLLVLSAFRLQDEDIESFDLVSQCTFWCSVLSDR